MAERISGILEYRPVLKYILPTISSKEPLPPEITPEVIRNAQSPSTEILKQVDQVRGSISKLLVAAKGKLPELGGTTGQRYVVVLKNPQSWDDFKLINDYEYRAADIEGNTAAELYRELVLLQDDWDYTRDLMNQSLRNQMGVGLTDEQVAIAEERLLDSVILLRRKTIELSKRATLGMLRSDKAAMEQAAEDFAKTQSILREVEKRAATRLDVSQTFLDKLVRTRPIIQQYELAINSTVQDSFSGDLGGALLPIADLVSQMPIDEATAMLGRLIASLRVSIEKDAQMLTKEAKSNTQLLAMDNKRAAGTKMNDAVHIRNEVSTANTRTLEQMQPYDSNAAVVQMAELISSGIKAQEDDYARSILDYHRSNMLDNSYRNDRLDQVLKKKQARDLCQVLIALQKHIQAKGSLPLRQNTAGWVRAFIEANGYTTRYDPIRKEIVPIGG